MLALFLASALALLTLLIALSAHWLGHITWLPFPLAESAWWWALVPSLLLFGYCYYLRRKRPAVEQNRPGDSAVSGLPEDSSIPAAVLRNERIVSATHAFWRYLGLVWSGREVAGVPFASLLHPYDHRKFDALMRSASRTVARTAPVELRMRRLDGSTVATRMTATPVSGANEDEILVKLDAVVAPESAVPDVPAGDEPYRFVTNHMEQVAFQTDREGHWIFLNASWETLTGFPVADSLGKPFLSYVHPDEAARNAEQLQCLTSRAKDSCWYETRLITSDGGFRWVSVRIKPILSEDGIFIGSVGTLADVTKRKMNEESLKASQRTLATLLGNFPGMIYRGRCDRNWTMEFISDGCFELTGYEACDLIDNLSASFNELIHPEDRDFVWRQVQSELAQNKSYEMEYRIVTQTGEIKWVWEHGRGVYSTGGDLLALDGFITDITARKQAEDEAKRNLLCDELTGLYNRATFQDRLGYLLSHSKAVGYSFAVLCLELDDFKQINDRYGFETGDRVLSAIGRRLRDVQRRANTVARLGSDEFAVLITDLDYSLRNAKPNDQDARPLDTIESGRLSTPRLTDAELALRAAQIAERLQRDLGRPMTLDGHEFAVTASIGIALSLSEYDESDGMLRDAVEAAHRAKFLGPSRYTFADQALHGKALSRRHIESTLLGAFDSNALQVFYRPIIALASGRVAWLDPVVRWLHPRRGQLEFEAFRVIAEDTGLLAPIARWLLREVCRQARSWDLQLGDKALQLICISLTGPMLSDKSLVVEVERALQENQLAGSRCLVQVSDIDCIADSPDAQEALLELKNRGVMIVVDDDGQAPSGPLNLKSLIADMWKVDFGRIQNENGFARLKSISAEAKAHGVQTIAGGIRTEGMLALAKDNGFVYGEGSFLSELVPAEAVRALLLGENKQARGEATQSSQSGTD